MTGIMQPVVDHIHITVRDINAAEQFYDRLLPILGFDLQNKEIDAVPEHEYKIVEYHHPLMSFGIVNARWAYAGERLSRRKPGAVHHIAFRTESREAVDRVYGQIQSIGATIVSAPRLYPEYCADYYAFFFKDTEGIEYEIVHFDRAKYFR